MKVLWVHRSSIHNTLSIEVATARERFCELSFFVQRLKISSLPLKSPPLLSSPSFSLRHSAIWHCTPLSCMHYASWLFRVCQSGRSQVMPVCTTLGLKNVSSSSSFDEANVTRAPSHECPVAIVRCNISLQTNQVDYSYIHRHGNRVSFETNLFP